jgi:ricin-type beta-trefoil lectin protein/uncharacterized protein DUF4232
MPGRTLLLNAVPGIPHRTETGDTMITSVFSGRARIGGFAAAAAACSVALLSACSGGSSGQAASPSPRPSASVATVSAATVATVQPAAPAAGTPPRCRTGQLSAAFTNLNRASGGSEGMTLILTNRSAHKCYVYGYAGLRLLGGHHTFPGPLPTHVKRIHAAHSRVPLSPGANAQAMLTWGTSTLAGGRLEHPQRVEITPPHDYRHLTGMWPHAPVVNGNIADWPLRPAPPGPVATGTGTVRNPFNGMCMTAAGNGSTNGTEVVVSTCDGESAQQWTAYSDSTLRINGQCLDIAGHSNAVGAKADLWTCGGGPSQRWAISQTSLNPFGPIIGLGSGNALTDPGGSAVDGTQLEMGVNHGDLSGPWHASFYHYLGH